MPPRRQPIEDPPTDNDDTEEEVDELEEEEQISDEEEQEAIAKPVDNDSKIIVQTAFDAYFTHHKAGKLQTSDNVFSQLVLPLSGEEYATALRRADIEREPETMLDDPERRKLVFGQMMFQLTEGFNILAYGLGSKRALLNDFATSRCAKRGHVVVANAYTPDFSLKTLLTSIESLSPFASLDLGPAPVEKQARRIRDMFSSADNTHRLFLIVHNIDAAPLRSAKPKSILALLAHACRIHVVGSIDNINAPLIWSSSEAAARKPPERAVESDEDLDEPTASHPPRGSSRRTRPPRSTSPDPISFEDLLNDPNNPSRGFAWLYHDLTTLAPYDVELAWADRSSLQGGHTGGAKRKVDPLASGSATAMTETAANHILASVTQKAQKMFILLANKQIEAIDSSGEANTGGDLSQFGMSYDGLFNLVRDNFIATSDTALRSLLGEFRDHNLVLSAPASAAGGEVLWIPLRKERLANVLTGLTAGE